MYVKLIINYVLSCTKTATRAGILSFLRKFVKDVKFLIIILLNLILGFPYIKWVLKCECYCRDFPNEKLLQTLNAV